MAFKNFNSSGGGSDLTSTFPSITMFDASTFYNWEQDNIPLQELKTRTDTLLQYAGYGANPPSGVTLVLSGTANTSAGIFDSMSDIADIIPKRLTFPLLIEICDYGDLGTFELADISTEGDGALEIINRQAMFDASAAITSVSSVSGSPTSATKHIGGFSSTTLLNAMTGASSTRTATNIYASANWGSNKARWFAQRGPGIDSETDNLACHVSGLNRSGSVLSGIPYSKVIDHTIITYDVNPKVNGGQGDSLESYRPDSAAAEKASVAVYGNYFQNVKIKNCHGQIKLNGVCVDSASGADDVSATKLVHNYDYGFDISDAELVFENCAAMRAKTAGFHFSQSDIHVASGCIAYRNYPKLATSTSTRTANASGAGMLAKHSTILFDDTSVAGSRRCLLNFAKNDIGIQLENSTLKGGKINYGGGGDKTDTGTTDNTTSVLQAFQNVRTGIHLTNSELSFMGRLDSFHNLKGIESYNSKINSPQFTVDDNQDEGLYLHDSIMTYGVDGDKFTTLPNGAVTSKRAFHASNNGQNIVLRKSSSLVPFHMADYATNLGFWGGHDHADAMTNHGASPGKTYNLPNIVVADNSHAELVNLHAVSRVDDAPLKGAVAVITDNSVCEFRGTSASHTVMSVAVQDALAIGELKNDWMTAGVFASKNSKVEFTGPTKISKFGVGVLAEDNSTAEFKPPMLDSASYACDTHRFNLSGNASNQTQIEIHANRSCVVANKNSGIVMYGLGGSSLGLSANTVDYVSNSSYSNPYYNEFKSCTSGSWAQFYPNGFTSALAGSASVLGTGADASGRATKLIASGSQASISTGGMIVRAVNNSYVDCNLVNFLFTAPASSVSGAYYHYAGRQGAEPYTPDGTPANAMTGYLKSNVPPVFSATTVTQGDTNITANALSNPSGYLPISQVSGGYGNPADTGDWNYGGYGTQLHLWNVADTSRIHAANLTINNADPSTVCNASAYHGPAGKWANGASLDYFGQDGLATTYGNQLRTASTLRGFENHGVFRLILGHRGDLKAFFDVSSGIGKHYAEARTTGTAMDQVNAQGYATWTPTAGVVSGSDERLFLGHEGGAGDSGTSYMWSSLEDVFGLGWAASAANKPAGIQEAIVGTKTASGNATDTVPSFPLPPLHMDWQGYMRNWVDESAANVFANAKHAANKKVNAISIYRSTIETNRGGEGRDGTSTSKFGTGLRSLNLFDLDRLL
jgi:hypothetical protein